MKSKNSSAGFSPLVGIILLAVVAILGFAGWYVFKQSRENGNTEQSQNVVPEPSSVKIVDLGLKIVDANSRGLRVEKVEVQGSYGGSDTVYAITPADYSAEYKAVCKHPSFVSETTADDSSTNAIKIGEKYYFVGKTILGCGGSADMTTYINDLHTYIVDNIQSL